MHILMLSSTFPYPPTRGGTQVRTFNLLNYLSKNHDVTLVTQRETDVTNDQVEGLRECVHNLVLFNRPQDRNGGKVEKAKRFVNFITHGTPPSVLNRYSGEMQQWIDDFVGAGKCDVVTCEHSVNEIYIRPNFQQKIKTIVNIHSSVYGSCLNQIDTGISENKLRDRINLPLLRRYEKQYCQKFSHLVVTTEEDKIQLLQFKPNANIPVIPNGVDLVSFPYRSSDANGHRLIFIGAMDNLANIDAVCFFANEVLPEIQKRYPDATFDIVGSHPTSEVLALQDKPGVNVTGKVPSMVEYLHQATICVVTMRTGFGIKNKTLEAMAAGVPVVGSDRALEGLAVDSNNLPPRALRANHKEEYIIAISQLLENPQLRAELSQNARKYVETEFTWESAGRSYEKVLL
jgi:polysaccharide biosynthesis protein PslH